MAKPYRIVDFSGGMNTVQSEYMIPLKDSVLLRNMTTEGNRLITLPGFTKYRQPNNNIGPVQGGATNGKQQAWIQGNDLYFWDDESKEYAVYNDAVGVGINGTSSEDEDYNVLFYKNYIVVTNSLKSGVSTLYCEGEQPRVFEINDQNLCYTECKSESEITLNQIDLNGGCNAVDDYAPITSIVYNGILYFGGGPKGSRYENMIRWGGLERQEIEDGNGGYISQNYLFNFCKELPDYDDPSNIGNFIPGFQYIGDGEPINSFFTNGNSLYIGKRNSIHRASQQFSVPEINDTVSPDFSNIFIGLYHRTSQSTNTGIKNQEVVHNVHGNTIYYDGTHVRRLEYDINSTTLRDITISYPMREFTKCITDNQQFATSSYSYPYLKFFLRTSEKVKGNNIAMVYNVETDAWSIQDGILLTHAWSGYDDRSDSWQGFWGSDFDNTIYKDNTGTTWGEEPREFEWRGRMFNFGDCVSYKTLTTAHVCYKLGRDTDVKFRLDTLYTKMENMLRKDGIFKSLSNLKKKFIESTGGGNIGSSQLGSYGNLKPKGLGMLNKRITLHKTAQGFQPYLIGNGYGEFELEYLDLYMESNNTHNYI